MANFEVISSSINLLFLKSACLSSSTSKKMYFSVFFLTCQFFHIVLSNEQYCVEGVCIPANYSRLTRPMIDSTNQIQVDFANMKILKVDDQECTITVSLWIYLTWVEPRLIIPNEVPTYVSLDESFFSQLWKPDVYFYHLKDIKQHSFFHDFEGLYFVNNSLLYNGEYEIAFYCRMIFEKYPLDEHVCDFKLTSFSYDSSVINFTLNKLLFEESQQVSLLDYAITVDHLPQAKRGIGEYGSLVWEAAGCEIRLERNIRKYVVNYYVPSGLLAMVSWVSF